MTNQLMNKVSRLEIKEITKPTIPIGIEDAEKIIGKSRSTIYRLCQERKIKHMKKGKKLYFYENELLDYINSGKRHTDQDIADKLDHILKRK